MSLAVTPPRGLTLCLGALTVLLTVVAIWPWLPFGRTALHGAPPAQSTERLEAPALPPIATFSDTVERPLFWPARRRSGAGGPATGTSLLDQRYRLLGVVAIGDVRRAVLGYAAGGEAKDGAQNGHRTVELAEGGVLDGWTLTRIDADSATFDGPGGTTTLALRPQENSPQRH